MKRYASSGSGVSSEVSSSALSVSSSTAHPVLGAQLIIDAPQHCSLEQPADDACYFQQGLLILGQLVDAAQDQAGKAGRQVHPGERVGLLRVDPRSFR